MTRAKRTLIFVGLVLLVFSTLASLRFNRKHELECFKGATTLGISVGDHDGGVVPPPHVSVQPPLSVHQRRTLVNNGEWVRIGLIDGEDSDNYSGRALCMSKDGRRIAIGSSINDGNGLNSGHVRAFEFDGSTWRQMGNDIDGETPEDYFGQSVTMSQDGKILAAGATGNDDFTGHVRAFKFDGSTWRQMGAAIVGKGKYDGFGRSVSISESGQQVAVSNWRRVEVYKWDAGDSWWKQMGHTIHGDDIDREFGKGLFLAGNGMRLAVGRPVSHDKYSFRSGLVRVFKWHHSSWVQMGTDIESDGDEFFGEAVAMSFDGAKVVVGDLGKDNYRGQVCVFRWNGSLWTQMGDPIDGEIRGDFAGYSVAMDSDGRQVLIGSPFHGESNFGHARVFEWNRSSWTQRGAMIEGEVNQTGYFGIASSMSGDGDVVAIGGPYLDSVDGMIDAGSVRIYRFEQEGMRPFPPDFEDVACAYVSCLCALIKDFGSPLTKFQDRKINRYARNSRAETIVSKRRISEDGNAVVSLAKLKEAMKWIKRVGVRGSNIGDDDAVAFANRIGNSGSECAIGFVESFIESILGDTSLDDAVLLAVPTMKLHEAREKNEAKKWKKSLIKLLQAIRSILSELGEKYVPRCNE